MNRLLFFSFLTLCIIGCKNDVIYDKSIPVNTYLWGLNDTLRYDVDIQDSTIPCDISLKIRHRDIYDYTNIYIKIITKLPNNEFKSELVSLPLCDETGKWLGKCTGDVCYNQILLMKKVSFPIIGKYIFLINHEMRKDNLKNILDIGLKIEKSKKKIYKENAEK